MVNVAPKVSDFMDKSFITLNPDMDVYKAIQILLDGKITGAAVIDKKEKLVGILSEKDCLRTLVHGAYSSLPSGKVSDFMTKTVVTIHPDLDIFTVADKFLKTNFRRLLVVKEGKLVGQITRRDLLRAIQKIKLTE
jgi:CBS domain-containing protein